MGFGILEDRKMELVPGTAFMNDQSDVPREYERIPRALLKHATGRLSHVVLVPQPTDSPNDPLNWSIWKKDMILLIVGLSAGVVGAFGPIAADLGISVNTLSQATGWLILTLGLCLFIINPLAKVYGKRPVYLMAVMIMFACSVWGALSKDYNSFLASRIVSALGMAPYEVLVQCTIGDLYFVHQRATRIAVWNLFLLCGIAGGSLISGYIIQDDGWKWTFGVCAIMFGVFMFLVFFFVPETAYERAPLEERYAGVAVREEDLEKNLDVAKHEEVLENQGPAIEATRHELHGGNDPKMSYVRSLRIFTGVHSRTPLWKIFLRPFVVFFYPAVLWAFLIYGTTLTWIVVFSVVNGVIFTQPPYNFSVSETGLISLSPFILTLVGEVIAGPLNDYLCLVLTKHNKGIYEPEFRLVLILPVMIIGVTGFYGFGATVHYQTHWIGPVLTFGFANMAMAFANGCVFGYVIDSYESLSEEAFVAINTRNLLTFGLTYFVNDWLAKDGALAVFNVLGSCFLGVCLSTIPLWIFGKRIRSYIARVEWLHRFMKD